MTWNDIVHFKPVEFDSPDKRSSGYSMDLDFVHKLDKIRDAIKMPLMVLSGYRTPEHNAEVGGVDASSHENGHAADLAAISSRTRFLILEAAFRIGFRRIGIGEGFIHLDDDITKDQDVQWLYPSTAKRTLIKA